MPALRWLGQKDRELNGQLSYIKNLKWKKGRGRWGKKGEIGTKTAAHIATLADSRSNCIDVCEEIFFKVALNEAQCEVGIGRTADKAWAPFESLQNVPYIYGGDEQTRLPGFLQSLPATEILVRNKHWDDRQRNHGELHPSNVAI